MSAPSYEGGIRPNRTEYLRESTAGTTDDNPSWNLFSDNVRTFDPDPGANISQQRGRGSADSQGAYAGTETPTLTVAYDLQQKASAGETLLDGSGNPNDAITDALDRTSDERIPNTHSVVDRREQNDVAAANTWSGNTVRDTRQYWVVKGAWPDEGTLTGDPEDGQPLAAEIQYECERIRHYQVDQPTSSEAPIELWVTSTDANDDSQTVTVQGTDTNDANQEEDISLDGTTDQQSSNTYKTVDAIELDAETAGNVEVYVDDGTGTSAGDKIAEIPGQDAFDHGAGSLGIPALGSGSHASAIGESFELYHDDLVEQPSGTDIGENWQATEFSVSNNTDGPNLGGASHRGLSAEDRDVEVSVTVFGETEIQDRTADMLRTATGNVVWTMEGGSVQADSASVEADADALEANQSKATVDLTFTGQGVTLT